MRKPPAVLANEETSARNSLRSSLLFPGRSRLYSTLSRSATLSSINTWRSLTSILSSGLLSKIIILLIPQCSTLLHVEHVTRSSSYNEGIDITAYFSRRKHDHFSMRMVNLHLWLQEALATAHLCRLSTNIDATRGRWVGYILDDYPLIRIMWGARCLTNDN